MSWRGTREGLRERDGESALVALERAVGALRVVLPAWLLLDALWGSFSLKLSINTENEIHSCDVSFGQPGT